jgi:poly-gamma-glutamate capsule biosynthesis protein CapA/YwtB (metallophosphatase superfamily)
MKVTLCGDIALCGNAATLITKNQTDELAKDFQEIFKRSDLFIANIECPLTDSDEPAWKHFTTLKGPRQGGSVLHRLGVDIGSLANNHIADYGLAGLKDTIAALEEQGITPIGAGPTPKEATKPVIFKIHGVSVAIIALAQPEIAAAKRGKWGAGILNESVVIQQITELKRSADIIIVYPHFGVEWFNYPTPQQVKMCRTMIDAGAKLVIGHHPHVPQGFEHYNGGFIAYSLGNFIFDMAAGSRKFSRLGLVIEAEFDRNSLNRIDIIPVDTQGGNPRLVNGKEFEEANAYLRDLCIVLDDERELIRHYYETCRDNFKIHLNAFIYYGLKQAKMRRTWDLIVSQFWPQIFRLRIDLIRFLLTGEALMIEQQELPNASSVEANIWLWICRISRIIGFGWSRTLKVT